MKKYSIAIFDLDGTIIDSSPGITTSVEYALDKKGYSHGDKESLKVFIGPPLREQFMKYCGIDDVEEGGALVTAYREYYAVKGLYECYVYNGIEKLLASLKEKGYKVVVATSKPEKFAKVILDHFDLTRYFDYIGGANYDNTRTDKAEVIEYSLKSLGLHDLRNQAVMIGDHIHDVNGAAKLGIDAIAVRYGFGDNEALDKSSAVLVCDSADEVREFLC